MFCSVVDSDVYRGHGVMHPWQDVVMFHKFSFYQRCEKQRKFADLPF